MSDNADWGECDWGPHFGPLWQRGNYMLCVDCRRAYDHAGTRKIIDLDMKRAIRGWTTFFNANNTETIRPEVGTS